MRYLLAALLMISIAACKKDPSQTTPTAVFSFDISGQHRTFNMSQITLQVIDTGAAKGKYLSFNNGSGTLPKVQFTLADRSPDYQSDCFSVGPYPSLAANSLCNGNSPSDFCVGFYMQYIDTGVGQLGLFAVNDSTSSFTLTSCTGGTNGKPGTMNGTFSCLLTDSTGFISPKQVTNGQLSYITFVRP